MKKRVKSFYYAFKGVGAILKAEPNFVIELIIAVVVIVFGVIFNISKTEWLFVVLCIGLVLSAETINTAIEKTVDYISPDFTKKAGFIKDLAAGAVLIIACTVAIIGLIIFIPKFF